MRHRNQTKLSNQLAKPERRLVKANDRGPSRREVIQAQGKVLGVNIWGRHANRALAQAFWLGLPPRSGRELFGVDCKRLKDHKRPGGGKSPKLVSGAAKISQEGTNLAARAS